MDKHTIVLTTVGEHSLSVSKDLLSTAEREQDSVCLHVGHLDHKWTGRTTGTHYKKQNR
jgi:hypothetical protein